MFTPIEIVEWYFLIPHLYKALPLAERGKFAQLLDDLGEDAPVQVQFSRIVAFFNCPLRRAVTWRPERSLS